MKKILLVILALAVCFSFTACENLSSEEELTLVEKVSQQCEHNVKLAFDDSANIDVEYDIDKNTWTLYIINKGLSAKEMQEFDWHGNGAVVLNLETSINSLCSSVKNTFDTSELKEENYTIFMHFTDINKKIYFTSENGVTAYSAWN